MLIQERPSSPDSLVTDSEFDEDDDKKEKSLSSLKLKPLNKSQSSNAKFKRQNGIGRR